jgi:hypothetical protein
MGCESGYQGRIGDGTLSETNISEMAAAGITICRARSKGDASMQNYLVLLL